MLFKRMLLERIPVESELEGCFKWQASRVLSLTKNASKLLQCSHFRMNTTVASINLILNLLSVYIYIHILKQAYSALETTLELYLNLCFEDVCRPVFYNSPRCTECKLVHCFSSSFTHEKSMHSALLALSSFTPLTGSSLCSKAHFLSAITEEQLYLSERTEENWDFRPVTDNG